MNIAIQSPGSTLSFGNADSGAYASLSTVGTGVTTKGLRTAGAVLLDSTAEVSKKGVVRALVRCRVPLFNLTAATDGATLGSVASKSPKGGFAQVAFTVTLPNTEGIVATSSDVDSNGIPTTQAAANATAVSMALQIVLNALCNQGAAASPVLVHGGTLMDYTLLGSDVSDNPIARGLMGLTPLSGANRGITAAAS